MMDIGFKVLLGILIVCNLGLIACYIFLPSEKIEVRYVYPELEVNESFIGCGNSKGNSMNYEDNYCHLYTQPTEENLKIGDVVSYVVSFKKNSTFNVLHRIVEIELIDGIKYYRTKGDNNKFIDKYNTTIENITKKVILSLDIEEI